MRKGSRRLLKTLMMRLSLVTASICGPGNWPLISIPCPPSATTHPRTRPEIPSRRLATEKNNEKKERKKKKKKARNGAIQESHTCCLTPSGQMSP